MDGLRRVSSGTHTSTHTGTDVSTGVFSYRLDSGTNAGTDVGTDSQRQLMAYYQGMWLRSVLYIVMVLVRASTLRGSDVYKPINYSKWLRPFHRPPHARLR